MRGLSKGAWLHSSGLRRMLFKLRCAAWPESLAENNAPQPTSSGVFWSANQRFWKQMLMVRGAGVLKFDASYVPLTERPTVSDLNVWFRSGGLTHSSNQGARLASHPAGQQGAALC